jgi:hypothetical protein
MIRRQPPQRQPCKNAATARANITKITFLFICSHNTSLYMGIPEKRLLTDALQLCQGFPFDFILGGRRAPMLRPRLRRASRATAIMQDRATECPVHLEKDLYYAVSSTERLCTLFLPEPYFFVYFAAFHGYSLVFARVNNNSRRCNNGS